MLISVQNILKTEKLFSVQLREMPPLCSLNTYDMKYEQRDIVEINFVFPDGTSKPHPALIVSNNELQEAEGFIYLCMISSKAYNSEYNYPLSTVCLPSQWQNKVMQNANCL